MPLAEVYPGLKQEYKEIVDEKCLDCKHNLCCKLFKVPLTPVEYQSGKYKIDKQAEDNGFVQLAEKENGECYYLGNDGKCKIWEDRPLTCREYDCKGDERIEKNISRRKINE